MGTDKKVGALITKCWSSSPSPPRLLNLDKHKLLQCVVLFYKYILKKCDIIFLKHVYSLVINQRPQRNFCHRIFDSSVDKFWSWLIINWAAAGWVAAAFFLGIVDLPDSPGQSLHCACTEEEAPLGLPTAERESLVGSAGHVQPAILTVFLVTRCSTLTEGVGGDHFRPFL